MTQFGCTSGSIFFVLGCPWFAGPQDPTRPQHAGPHHRSACGRLPRGVLRRDCQRTWPLMANRPERLDNSTDFRYFHCPPPNRATNSNTLIFLSVFTGPPGAQLPAPPQALRSGCMHGCLPPSLADDDPRGSYTGTGKRMGEGAGQRSAWGKHTQFKSAAVRLPSPSPLLRGARANLWRPSRVDKL